MAEILHGSSSTLRHAPLSQEQTLGMCKHLQGLIEDCQREIKELCDTREKTHEHLASTRNDVRLLRATVVDLKEETTKQHREFETIQKALAENSEGDKRVQEVLTQTCESVNKIRGGQETTNGNVHSLKEELDKHTKSLKDIENAIGKVGDGGMVGQLVREHQNLEFRVDRMKEEARLLNADLTKSRADVARLDAAAQDVRRSVQGVGAKLKEQAQENADVSSRVDSQKENLELTNAVVMKIHEGMENTRTSLGQSQEETYALSGQIGRLQEDFAKTAKSLSGAQHDITAVNSHVGTLQKQRGELLNEVTALQGSDSRTSSTLQALVQHLQRLQQMADGLQQDLKRTNSLVLPNLAAEAAISSVGLRSSSMTEPPRSVGQSQISSRLCLGQSQSSSRTTTPRKKAENAWMRKNIGSVPDRMAWI